MKGYLGIDVGSVSTNLVFLDEDNIIREALYIRTMGRPIDAVQKGLKDIAGRLPEADVVGVGATGSGRHLCGIIVGADVVKNEITTHATSALDLVPGVQTVIEIGGQDSKIIILRDGVVSDFAMNTVCAAGTGSFLDQQAGRLGIPVESFGEIALRSRFPTRIAGRCAVFAESDMIHKQQMGYDMPDILAGLCEALVRNYFSNVAKGKKILPPVVFQGGVAANAGMRSAFEKYLGLNVHIPKYYNVMGAVGAAIQARKAVKGERLTRFKGFEVSRNRIITGSFECDGCPNACEVAEVFENDQIIARWGDRCGRWSEVMDGGEKAG